MELGTASAGAGELSRGWLDVAALPTGGDERLPVVIAEGEADGPTLWLTGGVHGDEATGVAVAQDAMRPDLPERLAGTVVCVPVVSPAGLRRNARETYYHDEDPNRHFPDAERDPTRPPKVQERIASRLYEAIVEETDADALVDLHTAGVGSEPFAIRDRVLYGERRTREEAEALADDLAALVDAFGFPVLTEYPADEYLEQSLQRSTAGAVCNEAGIPAFTAELGAHSVVEEDTRAAGVAGVYAVLVELGMLDAADVPDEVGTPDDYLDPEPVDFPVHRYRGPTTETAGLLRFHVEAGDVVTAGDPIADVVGPAGRHRDTVTVDRDGYVIGRAEGIAVYEGDPVATLAVRDEDDLVVERDD